WSSNPWKYRGGYQSDELYDPWSFPFRLLAGGHNHSDVAGALEDAGTAAFRPRHETLQGRTFIYHDGLDLQLVDVSALIVFGVGDCRLHDLLDQECGFLVRKLQQVD